LLRKILIVPAPYCYSIFCTVCIRDCCT